MELRPIRLLRAIDRQLDELSAADRAAEEMARLELARSASRYSRKTKRVVDETMTLSATLVRAGEVEEANRLMAEAEREVRTEEAALIETVNEVKVAGEFRKRRLLRLKMVKAIATAGLSGSMFFVSAFGVVLARNLASDDPVVHDVAAPSDQVDIGTAKQVRFEEVEVAPGLKLRLSPSEAKELERLTMSLDAEGLRKFLSERIPSSLLEEVQTALLSVVNRTVAEAVRQSPASGAIALVKEQTKGSPKPPESSSPKPSPSPSPSEEPTEEPTPPNTGDGESDGDPNGGDDGPLGNLPLPEPEGDDQG